MIRIPPKLAEDGSLVSFVNRHELNLHKAAVDAALGGTTGASSSDVSVLLTAATGHELGYRLTFDVTAPNGQTRTVNIKPVLNPALG